MLEFVHYNSSLDLIETVVVNYQKKKTKLRSGSFRLLTTQENDVMEKDYKNSEIVYVRFIIMPDCDDDMRRQRNSDLFSLKANVFF